MSTLVKLELDEQMRMFDKMAVDFVKQAPQLREISAVLPIDTVVTLPPRITSLRLSTHHSLEQVIVVLKALTALTSLRVRSINGPGLSYMGHTSSITTLACGSLTQITAACLPALLRMCPALRHLSVSISTSATIDLGSLQPSLAQLESLYLVYPDRSPITTSRCAVWVEVVGGCAG